MKTIVPLVKGDLDCVARTLWAEARSEPFMGQAAVVWVMVNRLRREKGRFPKSLQDICRAPYAFSCWLSTDTQCTRMKALDESHADFVKAMWITTGVLIGEISNPVDSADHYHAASMTRFPSWAPKMRLVTQIGNHIFYSEKG